MTAGVAALCGCDASRGDHGPDGPVVPTGAGRFDFSGSYTVALVSEVNPGMPLRFLASAQVSPDLAHLDLRLQPLRAARKGRAAAIGEAIRLEDLPYGADGRFSADLGTISIPGEANPLIDAGIVVRVKLDAVTRKASRTPLCGFAEGTLIEPFHMDLGESTFGALPTGPAGDAELATRCDRG